MWLSTHRTWLDCTQERPANHKITSHRFTALLWKVRIKIQTFTWTVNDSNHSLWPTSSLRHLHVIAFALWLICIWDFPGHVHDAWSRSLRRRTPIRKVAYVLVKMINLIYHIDFSARTTANSRDTFASCVLGKWSWTAAWHDTTYKETSFNLTNISVFRKVLACV